MEVLRIKGELSDHTAKTPSEEVSNRMANVHEGHREKLRNRFIQDKGFENFEDHQILELLLFYANSRKDTNPLAHELLDQFGSLKGVLEARPEQLMTVSGIGDQAATLISMVVPLTRVWHRWFGSATAGKRRAIAFPFLPASGRNASTSFPSTHSARYSDGERFRKVP